MKHGYHFEDRRDEGGDAGDDRERGTEDVLLRPEQESSNRDHRREDGHFENLPETIFTRLLIVRGDLGQLLAGQNKFSETLVEQVKTFISDYQLALQQSLNIGIAMT